MDQILPTLYLGCFDDVALSMPSIACILALCEAYPSSEVPVHHRPIPDEVFITPHVWQRLVDDLETCITQGRTVLVHCRLGVSRSPALVVAYLAYTQGMGLDEALALVKAKRPLVNIHPATWQGVVKWHNQR